MEQRVVCIPVPPETDFVGDETLVPSGFKCSEFTERVVPTMYGIGDYLINKWQGVPKILRSARLGQWIAYCSLDMKGLPQNYIAKRILRCLGFEITAIYGPVVLTKKSKQGLSDTDLEYLDRLDVILATKQTVLAPADIPWHSMKQSPRTKRRRVVVTTPTRIEGHNDR
jgi:hypothetical protein